MYDGELNSQEKDGCPIGLRIVMCLSRHECTFRSERKSVLQLYLKVKMSIASH